MTTRAEAMSFVRTSLGFALPLVLLFLGLEIVMRRVPNSYALKRSFVDDLGATATVLVVGSSHEAYGVRATELGRDAINLANASQSSLLDGSLVDLALTKMPHLELVLIGLAHFSFGYRLEASPESWRAGFYQHYFQIHEPTPAIRLPQLGDFSVAALYDPGQMISALRAPLPLSPEDRGWERVEASGGAILADDAVAAERVRFHEALIHDSVREETVAALVRTLRVLESHHVRAAFVSMPEHALYRAHLPAESVRRNEVDLAAIQAEVPTPYLDLRADPRFVDEHFANHDHLDAAGATLASRILRSDIVEVAP